MSIQLCDSQHFKVTNHPLVFGVNSWHTIILAFCTFYSQSITDKEV